MRPREISRDAVIYSPAGILYVQRELKRSTYVDSVLDEQSSRTGVAIWALIAMIINPRNRKGRSFVIVIAKWRDLSLMDSV